MDTSPTAHVVDINGCPVHFWDRGEGPAVLMSHGAGGSHLSLEPLADTLAAEGFRAITWDMPIHGESRPCPAGFSAAQVRRDLVTLLDTLGLEQVILLGQSFGGAVAQAATRDHPERVRALVILGSPWITGPWTDADKLPMAGAAQAMEALPADQLPGVLAQIIAASSPRPEAMEQTLAALQTMPPKEDFLQVWKAAGDFIDPDPDYRTPVPLCLIRGVLDTTMAVDTWMPRWAEAEGITEIVIPNAGHLVDLDAPAAVREAIVTFLRSLPTKDVA